MAWASGVSGAFEVWGRAEAVAMRRGREVRRMVEKYMVSDR